MGNHSSNTDDANDANDINDTRVTLERGRSV